jgi:hypothetical protein
MICPAVPTSANSNCNNNNTKSLQLNPRVMPKVATQIVTKHLCPLHPAGFNFATAHRTTTQAATKILHTCVGCRRKKNRNLLQWCLICFQNVQSWLAKDAQLSKYRNSELFGHDVEFTTMNQLSWTNSVTDEMLPVLIYNWHRSVCWCETFGRILWDAWHAFGKAAMSISKGLGWWKTSCWMNKKTVEPWGSVLSYERL